MNDVLSIRATSATAGFNTAVARAIREVAEVATAAYKGRGNSNYTPFLLQNAANYLDALDTSHPSLYAIWTYSGSRDGSFHPGPQSTKLLQMAASDFQHPVPPEALIAELAVTVFEDYLETRRREADERSRVAVEREAQIQALTAEVARLRPLEDSVQELQARAEIAEAQLAEAEKHLAFFNAIKEKPKPKPAAKAAVSG